MRSTKAVRTGYIIMSLVFCALAAEEWGVSNTR